MTSSAELKELIARYGNAREKVAVGDHVLGVGTSTYGRFIEHAVVDSISGDSATISVLRRFYIDDSNQCTSSHGRDDGQDIQRNVPIAQFHTSIEDRLLTD